jgi:hypothetical protein
MLLFPGVKVTKKPSEEAHWSAPKLQRKTRKFIGTPQGVTGSILIGLPTSSMLPKAFLLPEFKTKSCVFPNRELLESNILLGTKLKKRRRTMAAIKPMANTTRMVFQKRSLSCSFCSVLLIFLISPGISAGAYAALISWIRGYQYTLGSRGSHHQIMTHPLSLPTRWFLRFILQDLWRVRNFGARTWTSPQKNGCQSFKRRGCSSGVCESRLYTNFERNEPLKLRDLLREKGIVTKDDYAPLPRSKGTQEPFRRGLRGEVETPKRWDTRWAYKCHPYFSRNLKYVC